MRVVQPNRGGRRLRRRRAAASLPRAADARRDSVVTPR